MQKAAKIGVGIIGAVCALRLASCGLSLMNTSSDLAVLAGLVVLVATGIAAVGAWRWLRRWGATAAVAAFALVLSGCSGCERVAPGYVGIKINMAGSDRGVEDLPVLTGWVFYNPFTQEVFQYPTFVQTAEWANEEQVSFNTKEGLIVTGDIALSYQLQADRVPAFYVKFRSDNLGGFTHGFMRNVARDQFNEVAGTYSVEEIYGPKKEEFTKRVRERINDFVEPIGVHIEQFGFIGAPRPPQSVIAAIDAKIAATQLAMQRENELRRTRAEADMAVARAKGEADARIAQATGEAEANRVLSASITDPLIEWRRLDLQGLAVGKWNGARPMIEGESAGGLLFQLPPVAR